MMEPGLPGDCSQAQNLGWGRVGVCVDSPAGEFGRRRSQWRGSERGEESRKVCSTRSEPPPASSSLTFKECAADESRWVTSWLLNTVIISGFASFLFFFLLVQQISCTLLSQSAAAVTIDGCTVPCSKSLNAKFEILTRLCRALRCVYVVATACESLCGHSVSVSERSLRDSLLAC